MLEVRVHSIKGKCPVYEKGDRMLISSPRIIIDEIKSCCIHALPTILHYALILEYDWCPLKLGLTTKDKADRAFVQCSDPGPPYTKGGTVIFEFRKIDLGTIVDDVSEEVGNEG